HMIANKSYLIDYKEIDGGFVAFGGNSKGWKITRKGKIRIGVVQSSDFKLTDESHVLLKVPRKDNMYSIDLKNVVPQGGLTCLFVKATSDESNLWVLSIKPHNKTAYELFLGNSTNSKAFRVFNSRTRIVEENLDVKFRNQCNDTAGTKACDNIGKTRMETLPDKDYILLPLWTQDPLFSSSSKDSPDAGFKPSGEDEKKDDEDLGNKDIEDNVVDENIVYGCADDLNMPDLEEIGRFSVVENDDSGADMNNLDAYF
nr:ribonuclease H-like domain-containing protein [Tanacetum cinerariifolium]